MPTLQSQVRPVRVSHRLISYPLVLESLSHSSPLVPGQIYKMGRLVCLTSCRWVQQAVSTFLTMHWRLIILRLLCATPRRPWVFKAYLRVLSRVSLHRQERGRLRSATLDLSGRVSDTSLLTQQSSLYQNLHRRLQLAHALGDRPLIEALEQELSAIGADLWRAL